MFNLILKFSWKEQELSERSLRISSKENKDDCMNEIQLIKKISNTSSSEDSDSCEDMPNKGNT